MENQTNKEVTKNFWKASIFFGSIMFIMMTFIVTLIQGRNITSKTILIGIPIWAIAGFVYGYTTKISFGKSNKTNGKKSFWKTAVLFGGFLYLYRIFVSPLIRGKEITFKSILIGLPIYAIIGILFSYIDQKFIKKKRNNNPK